MKILKLQEFTPPSGREYDASVYPGEGTYIGKAFGATHLISVHMGSVNTFTLYPSAVIEDAPPEVKPELLDQKGEVERVSTLTMLKAIAIARGAAVEVTL